MYTCKQYVNKVYITQKKKVCQDKLLHKYQNLCNIHKIPSYGFANNKQDNENNLE